jgi:hypothetical protein
MKRRSLSRNQNGPRVVSRRNHFPTYRLHKQFGQAIVTLPDGLGSHGDVLLSTYDSVESRKEYVRILTER